MRNRTMFVLAVGAFVAPLLVAPMTAQQPQQAPAQQPAQTPTTQQPQTPAGRNSVQVGVPQGRQGGQGQTTGGLGRGRAAGPPVPPPRNAAGRVLLSGATAKEKGVWIGGGFGRRS